ncbi:hypothetical protein [Geosporobacter ferrireducens]|uniref:Uncharacterized protein n=1 Tax=Geosporobacter ferrireducens TaxID=1424294 RepID=A0A1D8GLX5_9FIRM|nr:hypothetical protein [Geosporobacter ferrireducens]AOT71916.1 hypothetical protein Gferi_21680 [Geosporobacter ferrireducens]
MYRIFVESYPNVVNSLKKTDIRYTYVEYMDLLCDPVKHEEHARRRSEKYVKLCNLLSYIKENIWEYPRLEVLLYELECLGIVPVKTEQILTEEELEEGAKILKSIVKLNYWQ